MEIKEKLKSAWKRIKNKRWLSLVAIGIMTICTVIVVAAGSSITDTFDNTSKIAASTNITVSGGQVKLSVVLLANGSVCTLGSECLSGYCADGVCCNSACTGSTCQTCSAYSSAGAGTCGYVNSSTQDPDSQCAASGCYTSYCSGSGYACGYQTSSTDTYSYCADSGCYTGNCIGGSNACGYYSDNAEHNCTTACTTCNGATSGACVSMTNNTQDTQGSAVCSAACKKCSSGSCVNQTSSEDLFNQCTASACTIVGVPSNYSCSQYCAAGASTKQTGDCNGAGACGSSYCTTCAGVGDDTGATNGLWYRYYLIPGVYCQPLTPTAVTCSTISVDDLWCACTPCNCRCQ